MTLSQLTVEAMGKDSSLYGKAGGCCCHSLASFFWTYQFSDAAAWVHSPKGKHGIRTGDLSITATYNSAWRTFFLQVIAIINFIMILIYTASKIQVILSPFLHFRYCFEEKKKGKQSPSATFYFILLFHHLLALS